MKPVDLYAQPWKMPKWLGAVIGGVFGFILIGTGLIMFHLVRPAEAAQPVAVEAVAPVSPVAAPAQVETPPPVQRVESTVPAAAPHKAQVRKGKASKKMAKLPPASTRAKIVARHDSRDKRKAKDDLDRMLGL